MTKFRFVVIAICLTFTFSCSNNVAQKNDQAPNFILLIGDDMAIETLSCYKVGENPAVTPNLDQLCESGVRFDNFWAQPVCSPTRATLLTGQFGFANGVGNPITSMQNVDWKVPGQTTTQTNAMGGNAMAGNAMAGIAMGMGAMAAAAPVINPSIRAEAKTFVQALKAEGNYQTAAIGKWHLGSDTNGGFDHPSIVGFDHYAGSFRGGGVTTFTGWSKTVNGSEPFGQTGYAGTDKVDDSIAWLNSIDQDKPWFLWLAFNAPHTPFHKPPVELLNSEQAKALDADGPADDEDPVPYLRAMIEAMDTEIGRLLSTLDDQTLANTYIIFMGDNGTQGEAATTPYENDRAKGTVYQGGINVPFMIAGPSINAGQSTDSLANSVDFFATTLDLAGIVLDQDKLVDKPFHSVSLRPILHDDVTTQVRDFAYADAFGMARFGPRNIRAIRNDEYKLVQLLNDDKEEFYKLSDDPYENNNLLNGELNSEQQENYDSLSALIQSLLSE